MNTQLTDMEKWMLTIGSLAGGLDYEGVVAWLSKQSDLDTALKHALELRDGMVAT